MSRVVLIDYTNWKGERGPRRIDPIGMIFGSNEWHAEEQWLLLAWDLEKDESRQFAMKDIHAWSVGGEPKKLGRIMPEESDFEPMSADEKWRRDNWDMQPEAAYLRDR